MTRGARGLRLTVDGGNSRVKLALWDAAGEHVDGVAFAYGRAPALPVDPADPGGFARDVRAWLADRDDAVAVAGVSSVAGAAATEALLAVLAASVPDVRCAPDHGLENRTLDPPGVGLDRLYGARAALFHAGSSALVVDVGTAMTVDAVLDEGGGAFLGGAIAPGPELAARALAREGARLLDVTPTPAVRALGRDTGEAIRSGIAIGLRGAARALVETIAAEAGLRQAPVVLTGGARAFVRDALPGRRVLEDARLVHRGILLALER